MQTETSTSILRYPSKRDTWIQGSIWVSAVVLCIVGIGVVVIPAPPLLKIAIFGICALSIGFSLWILYGTYYFFTETHLIARAGPFRYRVPLERITKVEPSHSPLSAPACSLDRLHVRYTGSWFGLLVSPDDKDAFLADLRSRAPQLQNNGSGVANDPV